MNKNAYGICAFLTSAILIAILMGNWHYSVYIAGLLVSASILLFKLQTAPFALLIFWLAISVLAKGKALEVSPIQKSSLEELVMLGGILYLYMFSCYQYMFLSTGIKAGEKEEFYETIIPEQKVSRLKTALFTVIIRFLVIMGTALALWFISLEIAEQLVTQTFRFTVSKDIVHIGIMFWLLITGLIIMGIYLGFAQLRKPDYLFAYCFLQDILWRMHKSDMRFIFKMLYRGRQRR